MTIIRQILDEGREPEERPIPSAPGVADVSVVQDQGDGDAPVTVPTSVSASSTLGNLPSSTAQSLVETEQPRLRPHPLINYPSLPDTFGGGIDAVDMALRDSLAAQMRNGDGSLIGDIYAVGELQRALRSNHNRHLQEVLPQRQMMQRNSNPPPNALADYLQQQRTQAVEQTVIPPELNTPYAGVTRTLADGAPLSPASEAVLEDITYNVNAFDRIVGGGIQALESLPSFIRPPFAALQLPSSAEDIRDSRENLSTLLTTGRVSAERGLGAITSVPERFFERAQEVGPFGLITDAYFNVTRPLTEAFLGPITPTNKDSFPQYVQDRIPPPLMPAEEVSAAGDTQSFAEEVIERNPAAQGTLRRLLESTEPTNFAPSQGKFGDFGQGPAAALFYTLSLPEGIVAAAAYTATDTVGRLTGLSQNDRLPGSRFIDVLFQGEDLSFTQDFTSDKYLAFIGNPALDRMPRGAQVGLGFVFDLALGGFADKAVDGVKVVASRALRSSRLLSGFSRATSAPPTTALDDAVRRSADQVVRRPSIPGDDVSRLDTKINNALRDAAISTDSPKLVPDLDEAFRRFDLDDARPYTLKSAIADIDEQLSLPFMNTRQLSGRVIRRGLRGVIGEGGELLIEPTENLTRMLGLEDRIVQIQQLVDSSAQRAREVVAPPEEVFGQLTLEDHQQALRNSLQEQQTVMSRLSLEEAEIAALRINQRAEAEGIITVQNNGFIFQPLRNETYDTVLPTIPVNQVEPKNVSSTSEFMMRYRFSPDSVNDLDMTYTRRTDSTLENLGRVWSVENGTFRLPQTEAEELGNIYRARALEEEYPTLLSRFGKPVSDRIESPVVRVDFSPQFDTDDVVTAIPAVPPAPPPIAIGEPKAVRRRIISLQRRAINVTADITNNVINNDLTKTVQLRERLDRLTSALRHAYADNPEIAMQVVTESLPDSVRPVGAASEALTGQYVTSEQRFIYENEVLGKLRRDLAEVDRLIEEQRRVVSESPVLERVPILNEVATKRAQGLTNRTATAEMAQPGPGIRVPQLVELIGDQPTSFERVRQLEEFSDLTDEQLRRAIRNDRRVSLSSDGLIEPVREPAVELASPELIREGVDADSLRRVTRALSESDNSSAFINVSEGVSMRMNRSASNIDVTFSIDPAVDEYDLDLASMRNYLGSFIDRNPNFTYSVPDIDSFLGSAIPSDNLMAAILSDDTLPNQLYQELKDVIGDRFAKYREYYDMGFRLDSLSDTQAPLTMRDFARDVFTEGSSSMSFRKPGVILPTPPVEPEVAAIQGLVEQYDNFIPLFAVRETPEFSSLSRESQDNLLRSLQRQDIIEMSTLQDVTQFTPEQQAAGIPNLIGGDDFFVILSDDIQPRRPVPTTQPEAPDTDLIYFHGTKATTLDVPASSPSNEFGPGLYVSANQNVARRFARATPAIDLVDSTSMSPRFTNQGRIFPIEIDEDFISINIRTLTKSERNDIREIFRSTLRDRFEDILPRFNSWSKRHEPHEWWHYVRSQYMRENGGSVLGYVDFSEEVRDKLRLLGVDGIRDGDTLAILNTEKAFQLLPIEDRHTSGSIGEGWLNRYAADFELHNRIKNSTTQSILEQDRLAIDHMVRQQLADAVNQQQIIATRATRRYNETIDQMDEAVLRDARQRQRVMQQDTVRDAVTQSNRVNREVSSVPRIC